MLELDSKRTHESKNYKDRGWCVVYPDTYEPVVETGAGALPICTFKDYETGAWMHNNSVYNAEFIASAPEMVNIIKELQQQIKAKNKALVDIQDNIHEINLGHYNHRDIREVNEAMAEIDGIARQALGKG